jgi:hypothetical protein
VVTPDQSLDHLLTHALMTLTKQVDANAEEVKKAMDEAAMEK